MKAYITCPVSHSSKRLRLLPEIEIILEKRGWEYFTFEIGGSPEEIFDRDYKQLKNCNLIIAEVSEPSHGVGIEIGMSYCLGLKRILIHEEGQFITKLAHGMPDTTVIEYKNISDMESKLSYALSNLSA